MRKHRKRVKKGACGWNLQECEDFEDPSFLGGCQVARNDPSSNCKYNSRAMGHDSNKDSDPCVHAYNSFRKESARPVKLSALKAVRRRRWGAERYNWMTPDSQGRQV